MSYPDAETVLGWYKINVQVIRKQTEGLSHADSLLQLPLWKRPAEIVKMCRLVAFTRTGMESPDLGILEKKIPGITQNTVILDIPPIAISSSDIRERVNQGLHVNDLVPESVEGYIKDNGLYK